VILKNQVFWYFTNCRLVYTNRRFAFIFRVNLLEIRIFLGMLCTLKAVHSFEIFVAFCHEVLRCWKRVKSSKFLRHVALTAAHMNMLRNFEIAVAGLHSRWLNVPEDLDTWCDNLIPGIFAAYHWGVESGKIVYSRTFGHVPTFVCMSLRRNASFVLQHQRK
jgi:hypothetical protein